MARRDRRRQVSLVFLGWALAWAPGCSTGSHDAGAGDPPLTDSLLLQYDANTGMSETLELVPAGEGTFVVDERVVADHGEASESSYLCDGWLNRKPVYDADVAGRVELDGLMIIDAPLWIDVRKPAESPRWERRGETEWNGRRVLKMCDQHAEAIGRHVVAYYAARTGNFPAFVLHGQGAGLLCVHD